MRVLFGSVFFATILALTPNANAAGGSGGGFGFNVALGTPYATNVGLTYVTSSRMFSFEAEHSSLDITVNAVGVSLSKNELNLRWHPWAGSFFLGLGVGQQSMMGKETQTISGQSVTAQVDITGTTMTPHLGWLWGAGDGGFFFGLDFGMQQNSGASTTVTTNADASTQAQQSYKDMEKDVKDQGNKLGESAFMVMTLFRIGYLF